MTTLRVKSDSFFLLESAGWPVLLVESGGTIRKANQAAISLFGADLESGSTMFAALWGDEAQSVDNFLGGLELSPAAMVALKLRGKGGSPSSFSTWICPLSAEGGKRFIFQFFPEQPRPPSETKEGGNESHSQKQKLDCALQLARSVALDFNNALTSILGHTSLVLSKMEPAHPWRTSLSEVEKAAGRAAEIANQLAAFSNAERESPGLAAGNLNLVLRRVVEIFQRSSGPRITWSLDLESKLFCARFDAAKMQQALVKIFENSIEAMAPEGQITVSSRNMDIGAVTHDGNVRLEPGTYVCSEISDTGGGIESDVLPRVFEPFFTTKQGHRGLGLAWVYGIISNHGGGVAIASMPKKGASVRIYLPATKNTLADGAADSSDLRGEQTILVVDDEELVLNMSRTILSAFGYRVLTASSGVQGLEIFSANEQPIDLVITDLIMPKMSGHELAEKLHAVAPALPTLFMSGYLRAMGKDKPSGCLQKPFTSQELLRRVKQILTVSKAA